MNTNKDLDAIMSRIEKLLAMANDGRGNINEAATALSMANRLMFKYQLEHKDILVASLLKGDDLKDELIQMKNAPKRIPIWQSSLMFSIANYNECHIRTHIQSDGNRKFRIYGVTSDVQVTIWMFDYVQNTINRLCEEWAKTPAFVLRPTHVSAIAAKREYKHGCMMTIYQRTLEEIEKRKATNGTSSTDLVVVKQDALTKKYGEFSYTETTHEGQYYEAHRAGTEDAKKIDLNVRGVGTDGADGQLLLT